VEVGAEVTVGDIAGEMGEVQGVAESVREVTTSQEYAVLTSSRPEDMAQLAEQRTILSMSIVAVQSELQVAAAYGGMKFMRDQTIDAIGDAAIGGWDWKDF
jgi:hypothetical protein